MVTLKTAVDTFIVAQEADGSSPATLRWYRSLLDKFIRFTGDMDLADITTGQIRAYIIDIRRHYAPDTAHAHVRSQHKFWRWSCLEYGLVNPMRNIRYPAQPRQQAPKAATTGDVARLLAAIDTNTPIGIRDRAIVAFLIDTGARAAGVVSLTVANLDMDARRAVVTEKAQTRRAVLFTGITAAWLLDWFHIRSPVDPVFYNMRTHRALTTSGLSAILKRLKRRAGITGRVNPHSFRHAFAREYLRSGGDLATLSRLMGHKDVSTTAAYYAVFTGDELAEQHDQHSHMRLILDSENDTK